MLFQKKNSSVHIKQKERADTVNMANSQASFEQLDTLNESHQEEEETSAGSLAIGVVGGILIVAIVVGGIYFATKASKPSPSADSLTTVDL